MTFTAVEQSPENVPVPSKTQEAFERRDVTALTRIGITKCYGLHPPISTDAGAENRVWAHRRFKTSRYRWIQNWITEELKTARPGDTGSRMMTRLRWRLIDCIRKEYASRPRREDPAKPYPRVYRHSLPPREELLSCLATLDSPTDPVLLDIWERLIEAYPDWRATTNRQLAAVYGVHPNVIASRRHALSLLMHRNASPQHLHFLQYGLRLRIGAVRKTDIHRVESEIGHGLEAEIEVLETQHILPRRCPEMIAGVQCTYAQSVCPTHRQESTI